MPTNFVYFSSGNAILHNRTILSVLSLINNYHIITEKKAEEKIIIFTDEPAYYIQQLGEITYIEYILLTKDAIKQMMGKDDLIHRVKIGIIEQITQKYPTHKLFYIDSDTFFYKPFSHILEKILPETTIMHKFEYKMEILGNYEKGSKDNFREIYDHICTNEFVINEQKLKIDISTFASWNAGIIGLHPKHFSWLADVYQLTDQFYSQARCHAAEQFAFSYILQTRTQLSDCEDYNRHYWHQIEKQIADEFLAKKLNDDFQKLSLEDKLKQTKQMCDYLYNTFPTHEYTHRYNAMIAFSEKKYRKGYKEVILTLLKNPLQKIVFFKNVAYYTKQMLFSK